MLVPGAAESGVKLKEDQSNEKSKTIYPGLAIEKMSAIVICVLGETPAQAEEWVSFRGKIFSEEKVALELNISFQRGTSP